MTLPACVVLPGSLRSTDRVPPRLAERARAAKRRGRRVVRITRGLLVGDRRVHRGAVVDCIAQTWRQIRVLGAGALVEA